MGKLLFCFIAESGIQEGCQGVKSSSTAGSSVYLQSQNFPGAIPARNGCSCSIETDDCDSEITITVIQRILVERKYQK